MVYQSESDIQTQEEYLRVQSGLTALQYATYEQSPSGTALDTLIQDTMTSLRVAASSGDYSGLEEQAENYRKYTLRREYLLSSEANAAMTQAAAQLEEEYNSLQNSQEGATAILAAESGLFSSYVDGYEDLLTPDKLEGLGPKDLAAFSQLTPASGENVLGKLVTDSVWYYAVTVPGETAGQFEAGDRVDVFFDAISQTLPMIVYSVGEIQNGEMVVVLRSSQNDNKGRGPPPGERPGDLPERRGHPGAQGGPAGERGRRDGGLRGAGPRRPISGRWKCWRRMRTAIWSRPTPSTRKTTESFARETKSFWLPRN